MKSNLLLYIILKPLSLIYGALTFLRNLLFNKKHLKIYQFNLPILSIGNITAGGTGKTPFTCYMVELLKGLGYKPGIVSRGYGRQSKGVVIVHNGSSLCSKVTESGDEPYMMGKVLRDTPIIVSEERFRGIEKIIEKFDVNIVILDDAFQHRKIHRNMDIVLMNAQEPKSHYHLLPLGRLRESLSNLKRADIIIHTKHSGETKPHMAKTVSKYSTAPQLVSKNKYKILQYKSNQYESMNIPDMKAAVAFCGIAHPESFTKTLDALGVEISDLHCFNDHQEYNAKILERLQTSLVMSQSKSIITTEKDLVKLPDSFIKNLDVYILRMSMELTAKSRENMIQQLSKIKSRKTS
jgi:tetraacyldisaccharide 4'-kinase